MFLRQGASVFIDFDFALSGGSQNMTIPKEAVPATVLYVAGKVVRLDMEAWHNVAIGRQAIVFRKVQFGIFGAPVVVDDISGPSAKTVGVRLLNPGAVLQRRDTIRIRVDIEASVFLFNDAKAVKNFTAKAADISQGGLRLVCKEKLEVGDELRVAFDLKGEVTTVHTVVRSIFPGGSYGLESIQVKSDIARRIRKFIVDTQIQASASMKQRISERETDELWIDPDEYWDVVNDTKLDSLSVSTDAMDFQRIVFGAFDSI